MEDTDYMEDPGLVVPESKMGDLSTKRPPP